MRILSFGLASTLAAAAGATVVVVGPGEANDGEGPARRLCAADRFEGSPRTPPLPAVPPDWRAGRAPAAALAVELERPAADRHPDSERLLATCEELESVRAQLAATHAKLLDTEARLLELVEDHCTERFDLELDQWLDGPLLGLHEGEEWLRGRLFMALVESAEEHARSAIWDPELQEWYAGECPEEVLSLRMRIPDELVAQLAGLFRAWEADRKSRPRIMGWNTCGGDPGQSIVRVEFDGQLREVSADEPYVQIVREDQRRIDQEWGRRVNSLVDAEVYDVD